MCKQLVSDANFELEKKYPQRLNLKI